MNDDRTNSCWDIEGRLRAAGRDLDRPLTDAQYRTLRHRIDDRRERRQQPKRTARPGWRRPLEAVVLAAAGTLAIATATAVISFPVFVTTTVILAIVALGLLLWSSPSDEGAPGPSRGRMAAGVRHRPAPQLLSAASATNLLVSAVVGMTAYARGSSPAEAIMLAMGTATMLHRVLDRQ